MAQFDRFSMTTSPDVILREFLRVSDDNPSEALKRMAVCVALARVRAEDALPTGGMTGPELARLWRDLHPNEFKH